jgi:hypothetical protein
MAGHAPTTAPPLPRLGAAQQAAAAKKAEALANMRKYLDLTDKSFDSRLRYAQFLVYAGDFATLGQEVATLNSPDPKNPKNF